MSLFNNSKDKTLKAKMYGEPCECAINPDAATSEAKDGRLTKITIESPDGSVKVLEVHGVAMTTLKDLGDKYEGSVAVFGMLSPKEVIELWLQAKHKLVPELEETAVKNAAEKYSIKDLMGALKGILEDM